jgi:hypothetical protein
MTIQLLDLAEFYDWFRESGVHSLRPSPPAPSPGCERVGRH